MGRILDEFERWAEKREEGVLTMIGDDFNATLGRFNATEGGGLGLPRSKMFQDRKSVV